MDIFFRLILGHIMGDYLLQPLVMAQNKSPRKPLPEDDTDGGVKIDTAIAWSLSHSVIYSASVCLWLWTSNPLIFGLIFLSHWPIDFFGLADKLLKLIGGRTLEKAANDQTSFREFNIAFTAIVYTVTDNGLHLMLMYPIILWTQGAF